jgi:hypothetical protein
MAIPVKRRKIIEDIYLLKLYFRQYIMNRRILAMLLTWLYVSIKSTNRFEKTFLPEVPETLPDAKG